MVNQRNRLYLITGIVCFFAILWLLIDYFSLAEITVCPVKLVSGYPCPSCGTTRSIQALMHGHIGEAFMINPFGIISVAIIIGVLILLMLDLTTKKDYYYKTYRKIELYLQKHKIVSAGLIILVIINWAWNISKGL